MLMALVGDANKIQKIRWKGINLKRNDNEVDLQELWKNRKQMIKISH